MNYPKAIIFAAALIAGAIFFSVRAQAGPDNVPGNFQVSSFVLPESDGTYIVGAWVVDTRTGDLRHCLRIASLMETKEIVKGEPITSCSGKHSRAN